MSYCQTYNKSVARGHGTLIGNWLEEEILRDASGHTHLESSRHLDTFMRVMGDRPYPVAETFITSTGRRGRPPPEPADARPSSTSRVAACRRIHELAEHARESCMFRANALEVEAIDVALKERREKRSRENVDARTETDHCATETESSSNYKFHHPDPSSPEQLTAEERAERFFKQHEEAGVLEGAELVSRWTELASAPSSSVQQTPHVGRMTFGKDSFFSLPIHCSLRGLCKDTEALELLEQSLKSKGDHTVATQAVLPALQAFKQRLREAIRRTKGCLGFLVLKTYLKEISDERGLVPAEFVEQLLWDDFDVRSSDIPRAHLRSALKILTLMDKASIRTSDLVEFIWAPLAPCRSSILLAFQRSVTSPTDIVAVGNEVPSLRITRPRLQIQLDIIPDFLHHFLPERPLEGADSESVKAVALPYVLEALADLSQGVPDDAAFLATVSYIAEKGGFKLVTPSPIAYQ